MISEPGVAWRSEHLVLVGLLTFFVIWLLVGCSYPPDARRLPLLVSAAGAVLTLVQMIVERGARSALVPDHNTSGDATSRRRKWIGVLAAPLYSLAVWIVGFHMATFATMILLPACLGFRNWVWLGVIAIATVAIVHVLFATMMSVELPPGLLGTWVLHRFVYGG